MIKYEVDVKLFRVLFNTRGVMTQLCGCSTKMVDANEANYVLRGIPYCRLACMNAAEKRYEARQRALHDMEVREHVTRIIALDNGSHVVVG
jgi:hypothetical protein